MGSNNMNKINWRKEEAGIVFNFSEECGVIRIITDSASILEVESVAEAPYKFGLFNENSIIFVLAKFGEMDWFLMSYHVNPLYPYELKDNCKYPIKVFFIDKCANIVGFIRSIAMPLRMSMKFKELVEKQLAYSVNRDEIQRRLDEIYAKYSDNEMIRLAEIYTENINLLWLDEKECFVETDDVQPVWNKEYFELIYGVICK
jgi:hypothetical protein